MKPGGKPYRLVTIRLDFAEFVRVNRFARKFGKDVDSWAHEVLLARVEEFERPIEAAPVVEGDIGDFGAAAEGRMADERMRDLFELFEKVKWARAGRGISLDVCAARLDAIEALLGAMVEDP